MRDVTGLTNDGAEQMKRLASGSFTAFLDASVLYSPPLRDLLLELAICDLLSEMVECR
jgi:hypothetical protein